MLTEDSTTSIVRFIVNDELKRFYVQSRWRDHLRPDGVHLNARRTLLYLKNVIYAVRKYDLK